MRGVAHVARHHGGPAATCDDLVAHHVQAVLAAGTQHHGASGVGESARHDAPQARRRPGDDGGLAADVEELRDPHGLADDRHAQAAVGLAGLALL